MQFTFGKYMGRTVEEILEEDPSYCIWFVDQYLPKNYKTIELQRYAAKLVTKEIRNNFKNNTHIEKHSIGLH